MLNEYTREEEKELNKELVRYKAKVARIKLNDYYDAISPKLSQLQKTILEDITNAETFRDINWYLWNSGNIRLTLENIKRLLRQARQEDMRGKCDVRRVR